MSRLVRISHGAVSASNLAFIDINGDRRIPQLLQRVSLQMGQSSYNLVQIFPQDSQMADLNAPVRLTTL